jgi:hypothetical protein
MSYKYQFLILKYHLKFSRSSDSMLGNLKHPFNSYCSPPAKSGISHLIASFSGKKAALPIIQESLGWVTSQGTGIYIFLMYLKEKLNFILIILFSFLFFIQREN